MKKEIITGGMVIILTTIVILGIKSTNKKAYEFYDMEDNKRISSKCELKEKGAYCKASKGWVLVKQYEEVER